MSQIINGNKVFLDKVRGRWTVLFTKEQIRKQYGNEAEAEAESVRESGTECEGSIVGSERTLSANMLASSSTEKSGNSNVRPKRRLRPSLASRKRNMSAGYPGVKVRARVRVRVRMLRVIIRVRVRMLRVRVRMRIRVRMRVRMRASM